MHTTRYTHPAGALLHKKIFTSSTTSYRRCILDTFTIFSSGRHQSSASSSSTSSSSSTTKPFMVTTPIYYVNSSPHIGHLYSSVLADATARYHILKEPFASAATSSSSSSASASSSTTAPRVLFSTGTDEHGQKVEAAAKAAGASSVSSFCDKISSEYKDMSKEFLIEYNDFVRTTDPAHAAVVRWLWRRLEKAGFIKLGQHEGWYCQSDETFLTDLQVITRKEFLAKQAATKKELELVEKLKKEKEEQKAKEEIAKQQQSLGIEEGTSKQKQKQKQQQQHTQQTTAMPAIPKKKYTLEELHAKVSAESGHPVERVSESNYMFDLPALRVQLLALHDRHVLEQQEQSSLLASQQHKHQYPFVMPPSRASVARAYLTSDSLKEISVSRRRDRVPWAIRVPEGEGKGTGGEEDQASSSSSSSSAEHSVYVWLDALANYLTAAAKGTKWRNDLESKLAASASPSSSTSPSLPASLYDLPIDADWKDLFPAWPADVHIVGKDILKFHAIYWPAFCIGSGIPPPGRVVAHGHWTVNKVKMSKSIGNVVAPASLLQKNGGLFTPDAVRYFLLREAKCEADGDYSSFVAGQRCAKECSDTFGNLANRILNRTFMPGGTPALRARAKLDLPWSQLESIGIKKVGISGTAAANSTPLPAQSHGTVILTPEQIELLGMTVDLQTRVSRAYEDVDPGPGLEAIVGVLQTANKVHSSSKPWKLKVSDEIAREWNAEAQQVEAQILGYGEEEDQELGRRKRRIDGDSGSLLTLDQLLQQSVHELASPPSYSFTEENLRMAGALYTIMEVLRICAILLQPAMPTVSPRLLQAFLGMGSEKGIIPNLHLTTWASAASPCVLALPHHFRINSCETPLILFPKPPLVSVTTAESSGGVRGVMGGEEGGGPRVVSMSRKQALREEKEKKKLLVGALEPGGKPID